MAGTQLRGPEMPPDNGQKHEKWEAERQRQIRQDAIRVAVRRQEQEAEFIRQDRERVRDWEERRKRNPVPLSSWGKKVERGMADSRRRIILREAEIKEMQAAIRAENENKAVPDEDIAREGLVADMLNQARVAANGDQYAPRHQTVV
jgi:hypothetical protein